MFSLPIQEIDATELKQWIEAKGEQFRIIDVREAMEHAQGTIPNAELMPLSTLGHRIQEIERDREVVFICRSGARSGQVCAYLANMGYEKVYNLRGGMIGWVRSGFQPVAPMSASA
ncbi:rhodanese-like domain-containing protein [Endothiovibrio diazotrophicus]